LFITIPKKKELSYIIRQLFFDLFN